MARHDLVPSFQPSQVHEQAVWDALPGGVNSELQDQEDEKEKAVGSGKLKNSNMRSRQFSSTSIRAARANSPCDSILTATRPPSTRDTAPR